MEDSVDIKKDEDSVDIKKDMKAVKQHVKIHTITLNKEWNTKWYLSCATIYAQIILISREGRME